MINIENAKKAFFEYVKDYDKNNGKVALKIQHILRTADVSKKLATELKLDEENIKLAELIGLLHDIGRFEQIRIYNTFIDKDSINHGLLGVKILFDDGLIRKFISVDKYDEVIKKAILNHNKAEIENGLTEQEELHCKIIRDSDKTDIIYLTTYDDEEAIYGGKNIGREEITESVYKEFIEEGKINYKNIKSHADVVIAHFAYVFDFNYKYGLEVIKKNNYIDKSIDKITFENEDTRKKIEIAKRYVGEYIDKRIEL